MLPARMFERESCLSNSGGSHAFVIVGYGPLLLLHAYHQQFEPVSLALRPPLVWQFLLQTRTFMP